MAPPQFMIQYIPPEDEFFLRLSSGYIMAFLKPSMSSVPKKMEQVYKIAENNLASGKFTVGPWKSPMFYGN